jgi:hypothetical protein
VSTGPAPAVVQPDLFRGVAAGPAPVQRAPKPHYRLYIDEVGNPGFRRCEQPMNRFLSLTGVACALDHVRDAIAPDMMRLKEKHFGAHPDDDTPLILHRRELVRRDGPFAALNDADSREAFDADLFTCFSTWDYTVFTVVLDKLTLMQRYGTAVYHPYHYATAFVVERYARWLSAGGAQGDVMAEGQGGGNDRALKDAFQTLVTEGTHYMRPEALRASLTSTQLKVRLKDANTPGLQLADLLAHPACAFLKRQHGHADEGNGFGTRVMALLEARKFGRSSAGEIHGYGCTWLP